ncbi:MAG: sigma-54 interaction domain-containing protein [Candidatus Cryptobacteroides sp.]|nr:sigma-54-dependent Fis family transcriptional regulator [Bacteroidales bacterium]MDD6052642.1 sigma-54 dependent transcriptional regulator [Bacteroidales bacterium]
METQDLIRLKNKFDIVGNDAALNRALETAVAVAPTDLTVLVIGESGVGKENIPKIIHQNSLRRTGKYFAVNCGAIPEGTIESELFGHEKGSFTGAIADRKGYFEEADGGTLFLDEIGELPLPYQAKLLRVLQSGEFTRVGSSKVSKTDVRVIAATNVDLRHAVAQGKFRQDLYYRLNAIQINMPALRDMKDDIVLLFRKFSSDYAEKYGMRKISLDRGAIDLLRHYRWPGNIRQLRNIAETVQVLESGRGSSSERVEIDAATLAYYIPKDEENALPVMAQRQGSRMGEDDRQEIFKALYSLSAEVRDLRRRVDELSGGKASKPALPAASAQDSFVSRPQEDWDKEDVDIQEYEQHREDTEENSAQNEDKTLSVRDNYEDLIRKALEKHHGNRKKAADELGISERTLYRKMPAEFRKDGKQ